MPEIVKKYTITETTDKNGKTTLNRTNDGFNVIELMGIVSLTQQELFQQIKGEIKPDIIERHVIVNRKKIK